MDLHRGSIKVASEGEGFGSAFSFTIPLATEAEIKRLYIALPSVKSEVLRNAPSSMRIVPETPPFAAGSVSDDQATAPLFNCGQEHFSGNVNSGIFVGESIIGKLRVLVVDDSALNRKLLVRRFQQEGYECVEADDGDTAVERAKEGVFDVITMDNVLSFMLYYCAVSMNN